MDRRLRRAAELTTIAENAGGQYRPEWIIAAEESHEKLASHEPPDLVLRG